MMCVANVALHSMQRLHISMLRLRHLEIRTVYRSVSVFTCCAPFTIIPRTAPTLHSIPFTLRTRATFNSRCARFAIVPAGRAAACNPALKAPTAKHTLPIAVPWNP